MRAWCGACAVLAAMLTLSACGSGMGTADDGPAPALSPPEKARPLWPGYTPPASPTDTDLPVEAQYDPIEDVRVSLPLSRAKAVDLLLADPNVSASFSNKVYICSRQAGDGCPTLRDVAHRDFTGDGRDEAVVAVDDPSGDQTLLAVYQIPVRGSTVLPLLVTVLPLGSIASSVGRELLVTSPDPGTRTTTVSRYSWDGKILTLSNTTRSDRMHQPDPEAS